jgi:hypothetical protein
MDIFIKKLKEKANKVKPKASRSEQLEKLD